MRSTKKSKDVAEEDLNRNLREVTIDDSQWKGVSVRENALADDADEDGKLIIGGGGKTRRKKNKNKKVALSLDQFAQQQSKGNKGQGQSSRGQNNKGGRGGNFRVDKESFPTLGK